MARALVDRFEQRKATRAKLVDAALRMFSTSGYEHATVDDISQAAGYSKGAYYFHFSTKDDILLELLRMWTEGRTQALQAELGDGKATTAQIRAALEALLSYRDEPRWPGVLLEFWAQALRNQEVSKRLTEAYAAWRRQLGEAFAFAAETGQLRLDSPDDAAAVVLAAHDGFAVQVAIGSPGGKAMAPADVAESLLRPLAPTASISERQAAAQ